VVDERTAGCDEAAAEDEHAQHSGIQDPPLERGEHRE
jgi:hypothetical protein